MSIAKRLAALALAFACACGGATAATAPPLDGIYWDPHQSGRGYAVETQDETMFIAIYNYDSDGEPTFFFVQGTWNGTTRRVDNAHLYQVTSGPWIGEPFSPIGSLADRGTVSFEFPTFTTARFTFNGQTSNLQRFLFGYGTSADSLMSGTWFATYGGIGLYFGDIVGVTGACTLSSCASIPEAFVGARIDGGAQRVLVGGRQSDGRVFFLLDSSTSYYSLFVFDLRMNEWVGSEATFLKTDDDFPSSGLAMFAHRLTGPSFLHSAAAVGSPEDMEKSDVLKAEASARARQAGAGEKSVRIDDIRPLLPALKRALGELQ